MFVLGYSGHSYVVIDSIYSNGGKVDGYFDQIEVDNNPYGLEYFGSETDEKFKERVLDRIVFPSIGANAIRNKIITHLDNLSINQTVVKHNSAIISHKSDVLTSTFIGPGAILNSHCQIGRGCIINTGAIIEHECKVGDFSHIAPGAVLAGNVIIGSNTFVGANSVFKQGLKIGNNVTIGAGSVVVCDIPSNETWFGNPAKKIA